MCRLLRPFIWCLVPGLMQYRDGSDQGTGSEHQVLCKSRKNVTETLAMIRQAFGKKSMSCKRKFLTKTGKSEKGVEYSQERALALLILWNAKMY
jgi:hypothetical protein